MVALVALETIFLREVVVQVQINLVINIAEMVVLVVIWVLLVALLIMVLGKTVKVFQDLEALVGLV